MVGSANEVASPKSATPAYKYSCLKCKVLFSDRDALSAHYKSNWHKHNMVEISRGCKTIDEAQYNEVLSKYLALEKAKSDLASLQDDRRGAVQRGAEQVSRLREGQIRPSQSALRMHSLFEGVPLRGNLQVTFAEQ